jgi:hypothetical protein
VPYYTDVDTLCSAKYYASGMLCDEGGAGLTDSVTLSGKSTGDSGATWYYDNGIAGAGVLIIDLRAVRTIGSFSVFQMFSDSRTVDVRVHAHDDTLGAVPAWDDGDWTDISGLRSVGDGALLSNGTPHVVGAPLRIVLPSAVTTRFLRIDARAVGGIYVELRAVKAFAP